MSEGRSHISMAMRAAQFSPFAALTGFEGELSEEARLTDRLRSLSEDRREELDRRLGEIKLRLSERPFCRFVVFLPDESKAGGREEEYTGRVKMIDDVKHELILEDGTRLSTDLMYDIEPEG